MAAPDLKGLGSTGLVVYGGRVHEEKLRDLQGAKFYQTIDEMTAYPVVWAMLFVVEMLCRQAGWRVDAFSDSPEDTERAQFVSEAFADMDETLPATLSEILTFLPYGFSLFEIVYKRRQGQKTNPAIPSSRYTDGRVGWGSWSPRAQNTIDRWDFGPTGAVTAAVQIAPPTYGAVTIPMTRCLHFKATSRKGNPQGRTVLRGAYQPWYYVTNIQRVEAIGVERDIAGLPVASIPSELMVEGNTVFAAWKDVVANVRLDEQAGIVKPSDRDEHGNLFYDFQLLSAGGQRAFNTDPIISRYNSQIAMTMLADFILLGHEKVGSFALSSDKSELFTVALGAWLDTICAVVNDKAIPDLLRVNGMPTDNPPKLAHGDIEAVDLKTLGAYIKELSGVGVDFDDRQLAYLLEQANIPAAADGKQPRKAPPVVMAPKPTEEEPKDEDKEDGDKEDGDKEDGDVHDE